jgi:4-hydroxybenzoyl-CoA reductase beta subunit
VENGRKRAATPAGLAMHLPRFEYLKPKSVADCLALMSEHAGHVAVMAGGTDLLASMGQRLIVPQFVIGLRRLDELRGVTVGEDGSLRIGAGTTLTDLANHPLVVTRFPMLEHAVRSVASVHVRNMATLGGNLALPTRCWYTNQTESWRAAREGCFKTDKQACHVLAASHKCVATSSADTVPALIVLGARVTLQSVRGARDVALADFYRDDGAQPTVLERDELITTIHVPVCRERAAFTKVTPREGIDFGLGTIAAAIGGSNRAVRSATIVVNSIGSNPKRLREAERVLLESGLTEASIEAAAGAARPDLGEITNLWTPAGYKRRLVRVLLGRALNEIRRQKRPEAEA